MASITTYNGGLRRIDFTLTPNGKRRSVRLGRETMKNARDTCRRVEQLVADKLTGRPHDADLCHWLAGQDEKMIGRLRKVGLADGVGVTQTTLGEFLDRLMASMTVKSSTRTFYGHTKRNLLGYFTAGRMLGDITEADADEWRAWLADHEKLSKATVARRVIAARTFWRKAQRWKLVASNPFEGVTGGTQTNEARKRFIPREVIDTIMAETPDPEWRLLIALSRYGGLRCPSEHLALTWADVDWERSTVRVRSPKTERHDGHGSRVVPMFPELRGPLLDAYEAAPDGAEHVITTYRDTTQNLRTQFKRLIRRAGHEPWPKLWHNLRASRETELMREYDLATVCKWIGNTPAIAAKHYATSVDLDADFRRAAGLGDAPSPNGADGAEAQQKAQQSVSAGRGQAVTGETGGDGEPRENPEKDNPRPLLAAGGSSSRWAILDSNQ